MYEIVIFKMKRKLIKKEEKKNNLEMISFNLQKKSVLRN